MRREQVHVCNLTKFPSQLWGRKCEWGQCFTENPGEVCGLPYPTLEKKEAPDTPPIQMPIQASLESADYITRGCSVPSAQQIPEGRPPAAVPGSAPQRRPRRRRCTLASLPVGDARGSAAAPTSGPGLGPIDAPPLIAPFPCPLSPAPMQDCTIPFRRLTFPRRHKKKHLHVWSCGSVNLFFQRGLPLVWHFLRILYCGIPAC